MTGAPRVLSAHERRFEQQSLFFDAALGLVAIGRKIDRYIAELSAGDTAPAAPAEVETVHYLLLGIVALRRKVENLVLHLAADARPAEQRAPAADPERGLLR